MKKVFLFSTLALIALFFACQKDVVSAVQTSAGSQNLMNVSKAKEWFNETEPKTVWTQTTKQEPYKPQWDKAVQLNGAIEVPVLLEYKTIVPSFNYDNPKQRGVARLLVACSDGKNINAAIIKYFPSEKFVGSIDAINRDNFREKKFDGMIKLENFDFTDQKVVSIENGTLTYFMVQSDTRQSVQPRDYMICYPPSCVTFYGYNPYTFGQGGYSYSETTCAPGYCVYVPTGLPDITGTGGNLGLGGTGNNINQAGAGILGDPITSQKKLCPESVVAVKRFEAYTLSQNYQYDSHQTILTNVNIEFSRPNGNGSFTFGFDYLTFIVKSSNDIIFDSPSKIQSAVNQTVFDMQRDIQLGNLPPQNIAPFPILTNSDARDVFSRTLNYYLTQKFGVESLAVGSTVNPNQGYRATNSAYIPNGAVKTCN